MNPLLPSVPSAHRAPVTWVVALVCAFVMLAYNTVSAAESDTDGVTLSQGIAAALRENPELRAFAFRLRVEDARIDQAGLRPSPSVSIGVENFAGTGELRGAAGSETTLALSQVVELGGKRDARLGAARAARDLVDAERQARQLDVLAEVTRRFIVVAGRQEELRVARTRLQLAERTVVASERRTQAAKAPHAELDRARIARDRARLDVQRTETERQSALRQLAATWGAGESTIAGLPFDAVQANLFAMPRLESYESLRARLADNPDFLRFASEARLRDAERRLATAWRRPDITLSAGVRRLQLTQDQAFVASVSIPLFTNRRAAPVIAEADAGRELVGADREAARIRAEALLYALHMELTRSVQESESLRTDVLPRTLEALEETQYAYDRGRYGYLELVDAQREYLAVEAALIDSSVAAHTLRTEIERLTNAPVTPSAP